MTTEHYGYQGDRFYQVQIDDQGQVVGDPVEVPAEVAVPRLIDEYLHGSLVRANVSVADGAAPTGEAVNEADFAEGVLVPAFEQVFGGDGTLGERFARMRQMFGDSPDVVRLATQRLGPEIASQIWSPGVVARYTQNDAPADQATPAPADVIQGARTQGVGPLPPAPPATVPDSGGQGTASSPRSDAKTGGDPLVLASGQLYHQVTDLEVAGRGLHFAFTRTYLHQSVYKGPIGYCWDHSYNLWLREAQEVSPDGTVQNAVYRSTGQLREDRYVQQVEAPDGELPPLGDFADATFTGPPGYFDRLEKAGGRYFLEMPTGVRVEYDEDLLAERIVDRNGNELTFSYLGGRLTAVRDPVGKEFAFEYDRLNRITVLHDRTGDRRVGFSYGANGDLEEVDLLMPPDLAAGTDYRYLGPDVPDELQHNLVEMLDPYGRSILEVEYGAAPGTWEYNRVVRQRSADGEFGYAYGPVVAPDTDPGLDPVNVPQTWTEVTYPNGHTVEHQFNSQANVVRRSEAAGTSILVSRYQYNADGLLTDEELPDGSGVRYRYGREAYADLHGGDASGATPAERMSFGNLLRRAERPRRGSGEARRIVTDYTYEPDGTRLATQRGPYYADPLLAELPGQAVNALTYRYDARGNLTRIEYPSVLRPDGTAQQPAPATFGYDAHGCVTDVTAEDTTTTYVYFADLPRSGFVRQRIAAAGLTTAYEVDALGRVERAVTADGLTTESQWTTFDACRRVTTTAPGVPPRTVTFEYDKARRPASVTEVLRDADGRPHPDQAAVQRFRYDHFGRLVETTAGSPAAPTARTSRAAYDPDGAPRAEFDSRGTVRRYRYDERRLLTRVTDAWNTADAVVERYRYDALGQLTEIVDGRGLVSRIVRDPFGRPWRLTDPAGTETEIEYDAAGRPTRQRLRGRHPETGRHVLWSDSERRFDRAGRLVERIDHLFQPGAAGPDTPLATTYWYDTRSRLTGVADQGVLLSRYEHDALGRVTEIRDADGNATEFHYDDAARRLRIVEREVGVVTEIFTTSVEHDPRGLPVAETDGLGNITRYRYDSRGLTEEVTDPAGHVTRTAYDVFGNPVVHRSTVGGVPVVTTLAYDEADLVRSLTSPVGGVTAWRHDPLGRVVAETRGGDTTGYTYDRTGNVTSRTDPDGTVIYRSWTPAGLLAEESVDTSGFRPLPGAPAYTPAAAPTVRFGYTPAGSVAAAENDLGRITRAFDSLDRLVAETADGRTVGMRYDAAGRRTTLVYPDQREIRFDHTPGGVLTGIRQTATGAAYPGAPGAAAARTLARIDRVGARPHRLALGDTHAASLRYDAGKRVVAADWTAADGSALLAERSLYGPRGEWRLEQTDRRVRVAGFDDLVRLVSGDDYDGLDPLDPDPLAPPAGQADADAVLAATLGALGAAVLDRSFRYDLDVNANRLGAYQPDQYDRYRTMRYDRSGNLLDDTTTGYRYDGLHRLVEAAATRIGYDALGRPSRLETPAGVRELTYAAWRLVEWRDGGVPTGQLVPFERPHQYAHLAAAGADYAPLTDRIDTVLAWVAADGTIVASGYDPFGVLLARDPDWPAPVGWAGYWELTDQHHLLPARVYVPRIGRFLQPDPLGFADGSNLYAYAGHAPGTLIDHLGLTAGEIDWGTVAWEAGKTLAKGAAFIAGGAALVAAGVVSAPFVVVVGAGLLVAGGVSAYVNRSVEAIHAGQTDYEGRAALAALGDTVGITNLVEGARGHDAVTDRALDTDERSRRLGTGIGSVATAVLGGKIAKGAGGLVEGRVNPYTIPSLSRPTYNNPVVIGRYRSPQGVIWEGNVFRGARDGFRTWRAGDGWTRGWRGGMTNGTYYKGAGNYWHVRSHFENLANRPGTHSYFDPALRTEMVRLADAPYIAGKGGGSVEIGGMKIHGGLVDDVRAHLYGGPGGNPNRGGAFVWNEGAPRIGQVGGNPNPHQAPAGTALSSGYRVIVEGDGTGQAVKMVTMFPQ